MPARAVLQRSETRCAEQATPLFFCVSAESDVALLLILSKLLLLLLQRSDPIAADRPTTGHADGGDALAALLT